MRLRTLVTVMAITAFLRPATALAQNREPAAGAVAIGGDVGLMVADDTFHVGFTPAVTAEFYLTDRTSIRLLGGWSRNRYVGTIDRYQEQYRGALNVVYNWEAELWHPFVAAGVGAHRVRAWQDDVENSGWDTRLGLSAGGGVEYFARPKVTIKVEGLYHWVAGADNELGPRDEASGFVISIGLKKYF